MRTWLLGSMLALAACGTAAAPAQDGCAKDTDCKGERVCVAHACVDHVAPVLETREQAARAAMEKARDVAERAERDAHAAQDSLATLQQKQADLAQQTARAVDAVAAAPTEADRERARAALQELRENDVELRHRIEAAKVAAERIERMRGVSQRCFENPLAAGCD